MCNEQGIYGYHVQTIHKETGEVVNSWFSKEWEGPLQAAPHSIKGFETIATPVYLAPPTYTAIAAMVIKQAAEALRERMFDFTLKAGHTKESVITEILSIILPTSNVVTGGVKAWGKWFNGKYVTEPSASFLPEDALAAGWEPLGILTPPTDTVTMTRDTGEAIAVAAWQEGRNISEPFSISRLRAIVAQHMLEVGK